MIQKPRLPKSLQLEPSEALTDHIHVFQSSIIESDYSNLAAGGIIIEQNQVRKTQFTQSNFPGIRIVDSILDTCEISAAEWEKAFFRRVIFKGCRLQGTQMLDCILEDVDFVDCQARDLLMVSSKFKNCRFKKCDLRQSSFDGADLGGVSFENCDLEKANFHEARLVGTDFRSSVISGLQVGVKEMMGAVIAPHQVIQVVGLMGVVVQDIEDTNIFQ